MQTLSYGYQKPESGDVGSLFFPALEDDIQQVNDHDHDGVNSALIPSHSIVSGTVTALAVDWVATTFGMYRQLITCPTGWTYDDSNKEFRLASGATYYPLIEKVSATTFYLYINDNTQSVVISFR